MLLVCSVFSASPKASTNSTGIYLTNNWSLTLAYDFHPTQLGIGCQQVTDEVIHLTNDWSLTLFLWFSTNQCHDLDIGCPQATVEVIATAAMQRLGDSLHAVSCIHPVQRREGLLTRYYCNNSICWQTCLIDQPYLSVFRADSFSLHLPKRRVVSQLEYLAGS